MCWKSPILLIMLLCENVIRLSRAFTTATVSRRNVSSAHRMVVSSFDLGTQVMARRSLSSTGSAAQHHDNEQQQQQDVSSAAATTTTLDPLIVCGPSGVGKGTIIEKFMAELGGQHHFGFTVSHTTRAPRAGEIPGVHYHFVSMDDMHDLLGQDAFLEHAQVHNNYYGTSWQAVVAVQESGKRCLLDIDVQGVQRMKQLQESAARNPNNSCSSSLALRLQPKYVFIAPPSLEALEERLIRRNSESPESLRRRLGNARAEVEYGHAPGNFDAIVINDDLEKAVRDFETVVREFYDL